MGLDHDGQDRLAGLLIGEHDDHVREVLGRREQGEEKGLKKGLEKGLKQGAVASKSEDLIKVIKARGLDLTQPQQEVVSSCSDLSQLATWFDQALDAKTTDEILGSH